MDLVTSVRTCLTKYATFDGRASRSEFWWFFLAASVVIVAVQLVQNVFVVFEFFARDSRLAVAFGLVTVMLRIATFAMVVALAIPFLAVGCRRLHDRGQSGWLQMLLLVPCGSIALIVLWIMEGTPGPNGYGLPPAPESGRV